MMLAFNLHLVATKKTLLAEFSGNHHLSFLASHREYISEQYKKQLSTIPLKCLSSHQISPRSAAEL